ncbi:MAG: DUF1552 domain-containing protein, partial [Planctomycetota bacterium]
PLLDAMAPALAAMPGTANRATRLSFVYAPNGMIMNQWTPAAEGAAFELTPTLQPLAPFRDRMLVLSGLNHNAANALPGEGELAPHERAGATFLTGVHPKMEGSVGISVDQIAAQELGKHTQLASLEMGLHNLGLHNTDVVGRCERGWSCAYLNTLSWSTATTPLPSEGRPRAVFERLFGDSDSTDPAARLAQIREDRSLLDSVREATASLMRRLGPSDSAQLTQYLDAVRDVERRIQVAEEQTSRELPAVDRPAGYPDTFDQYARLMFDLQVLAYQTDMTRVSTFMMGRESSTRAFPEIGIPDAHHPLSHHMNDPEKIAKVIQIDLYHSRLFAYFLEKMEATPDGDGSLLDHTMIVYGSAISDGNGHSYQDLPILLFGNGEGQIKQGRHIRFPKDTPMSNLYLTILGNLGIPLENFGDSTGKLETLSLG